MGAVAKKLKTLVGQRAGLPTFMETLFMRILINDVPHTEETYRRIFRSFGYESNELIFQSSFENTRAFMVQQLEINKLHIDLIITNQDAEQGRAGVLQADQLRFFKNQLVSSYSNRNFRIAAIPLILYSDVDITDRPLIGYSATVQKNQEGFHDTFIRQSEAAVKTWRRLVLEDLESLRLTIRGLANFPYSKAAKDYFTRAIPRAEHYFFNLTKTFSLEFIQCPSILSYDWIQLTSARIEQPHNEFNKALKHHLKYNSKMTERTVWHTLFRKYNRLLLRDVYPDYLYEKNLRESKGRESQECDFILTTEFPEQLNTTFLEVKREDKQYYVRKHSKSPQYGADFQADLKQVWRYYKYTVNPMYEQELAHQVGYTTNRFDFLLLAGRKEEKEEMQAVFEEDLHDHFPGIQVHSFEEFGETYASYIHKFGRLAV
jgi:hypothetical protein